jgi:pilus assembly protein Flp/PilA
MKLFKLLRRFGQDQSGASLVEYGVALIVVVTVGLVAMQGLGNGTSAKVGSACSIVGGTCS